MTYLLLAALCSLLLIVIFKQFDHYGINHNQAIVVNYNVCVITGCLMLGEIPLRATMINEPWMPLMVFLGVLFVGGFNVASRTIRHFGVAISAVAQRMSMAISVSFSIWYYNEAYTNYKVMGILVALLAVVLINIPQKASDETTKKRAKWLLVFPIGIFFISAIIEILLQYLNKGYQMQPDEQSIVMFGMGGIIGILVLLFKVLLYKEKIEMKNVVAGIILGIPNYFSLYLLLFAFETMDGSTVYALNNIIIVVGAALIGLFVFKEKLSNINILGIAFAVFSIFLITL